MIPHLAIPTLSNIVSASLEGKVAIVTGAGQGIGRVFAKAFALAGAKIVVAEKNRLSGEATEQEVASAGGETMFFEVDVGDQASVESMVEKTGERFGGVDILVNNAAIFSTLDMRSFDNIPLPEWNRVMQVNVTGSFLCARAVLPMMKRNNKGRIINIASGAVTLGRPNYLHYVASKGAVITMTRSMARELGPFGITVNSILPGATFTEIERKTVTPAQKDKIVAMQCIPRPQAPEDLVGPLLFLASDASAFVTGQAITVDGGATHP
jgi:3-oxoacyl-[acyl-carrier protein] reductase